MADMTEVQALANIQEWSRSLPKWQRYALKCLYRDEELDIENLTARCKGNIPADIPLLQEYLLEHIPDPEDAEDAEAIVNLRAIRGVKNVNALMPGQSLTFAETGLTVVYGNNGSGKSGYARILKQVCRSRAPEEILPNVYKKEEKQEATIDFSINGHNDNKKWTANKPGELDLSLISIFDSGAANVHVNEDNELAYTPFPLRVLKWLAEACDKVKGKIKKEADDLKYQTPDRNKQLLSYEGTEVHKLITELSHETNKQAVRDLAELREEDKKRLEDLERELSELNSNFTERAKRAGQLEKQKRNLGEFDKAFKIFEMAVSDEQFKRLTDLHKEYQIAREAAKHTAGDLFKDEPLPDIGSDVWRKLWEAARTYSEWQAYQGKDFPFTEEGALCPLCLQKLGAEAASRFTRFKDFVQDDAKKKEEKATGDYNAAQKKLEESCKQASDRWKTFASFVLSELNNDVLAESIRSAAVMLRRRGRVILRDHTKEDQASLRGATAWPTQAIKKYIEKLSQRISELLASKESEERKRMRQELRELKARKWLAGIKEDVIAEISHLKKKAALYATSNGIDTTDITNKSNELVQQLVTDKLCGRFSEDFEHFNSTGLKIELSKTHSRKGVPYFKIILIGISSDKLQTSAGEILSEGEKRCVALAAFLAELATTENRSAIVFDDPISSLDHGHRKEVAKRLAEEGKRRQVIVLTHDIVFLSALKWACKKDSSSVDYRFIAREKANVGVVHPKLPMQVKKAEVNEAIKSIKKELKDTIESIAKKNGKNHEVIKEELNNKKFSAEWGDEWKDAAECLVMRLRLTWEQAVEHVISPVLKRLSDRTIPTNLKKLSVLDEKSCTEMCEAYERLSPTLHCCPEPTPLETPSPCELEKEIAELQKWFDCIKERQKEIKTQ